MKTVLEDDFCSYRCAEEFFLNHPAKVLIFPPFSVDMEPEASQRRLRHIVTALRYGSRGALCN